VGGAIGGGERGSRALNEGRRKEWGQGGVVVEAVVVEAVVVAV